MRTTTHEDQTYIQLARRGDPSAFYALFYGQIRGLYVLHRSRGADHGGACLAASEASARAYRKFIGRGAGNPRRWFASVSGLGKFDAATANVGVTGAEDAECGRKIAAALNKAYSDRLDRGNDGKGNFTSERPWLPYLVGFIAVICLTAFLFFSQFVITVSLGRFGGGFSVSFPKIAASLWDMSGLVRAGITDTEFPRGVAPSPAALTGEIATGEESTGKNE